MRRFIWILSAVLVATAACAASPLPALIVDGQNNHDWKKTTPVLKQLLEESGLFKVDVVTSPPKGEDFSNFNPDFSKYKVVISNYNGEPWPETVQLSFEKYVANGGGFVSYHAADNAFPKWQGYNQMIGEGGWGNQPGPYWYFKDGKLISDDSPGPTGSHGARHPFRVVIRNSKHPITKGLPPAWMHTGDELYARLRGPFEHVTVLGTAFSDPENKGTGHDEAMLMAISFGKGRVFHTTLGHDVPAMQCAGFITTFQRGAEWAATGKVTVKVPKDFPTADQVSIRP
jgi:type 1 glutamine amidotransferase